MNLGSMSAVALKRTRLRYQSDLAKLTPHQETIAINGAIQVYTWGCGIQTLNAAPYARPWLLALISIPRPSFGSTWLTHLSSALKHNWLNGDLVDDRFQVPKAQGGPWWGRSSCRAANWIIREAYVWDAQWCCKWVVTGVEAASWAWNLWFRTLNRFSMLYGLGSHRS